MAEKRSSRRKFHFVYKTTCNVTGRFYIGVHSTDVTPGADPYLGSGKLFQRSLKKHGKENHVREILAVFEDRTAALAFEARVVDEDLVKDPNCMNLIKGGGGYLEVTDETRSRMSESGKRRKPVSDETRQRLSEAGKGRVVSDETREKIRVSCQGQKRTTDQRAKIGASRPKQLTLEHRLAISEGGKGRKHGEATLEKMRAAKIGKRHTEESKKKMSEAKKGRVAWNAGQKGVQRHSDETREKMREAQRLRRIRESEKLEGIQ